MRVRLWLAVGLLGLGLVGVGVVRPRHVEADTQKNLPVYTKDGMIVAPPNYREWVYLTTGFDMTYSERTGPPDHSTFDNVFVNPEAYRSFLATGAWPDKTIMVLEHRDAESKGEVLVKGGRFQGVAVTSTEIHVKDSAHFNRGGSAGQWGFFGVNNGLGKVFAPTASCYSCHEQHAAVDTTFVQFYPVLLPLAEARKTLSEAYLKDRASIK